MEVKSKNVGNGTTFPELLTLAFVILKLCGVIKWSWIWILAPIWIQLIIMGIIFVVFLIKIHKENGDG